jgi:hypothetical protein
MKKQFWIASVVNMRVIGLATVLLLPQLQTAATEIGSQPSCALRTSARKFR